MVQKNSVYLWKNIFTVIVIILHCYMFDFTEGWYLGVEFFFIVAGYILAESEMKKCVGAYRYTLHRVINIYPYYILAFVLCTLRLDVGQSFFERLMSFGMFRFPEFFMLQYVGFKVEGGPIWINPHAWFISVLIFGGGMLYSLLHNYKKFFLNVVAPFFILFFLSKAFQEVASLSYNGMYRGLAEMSIGIMLNYFSKTEYFVHIKNNILFHEFGNFCIVLGIVIMTFYPKSRFDFLVLLLFSVGVLLLFTTESRFTFEHNKIVLFFNKISIIMYLNSYFVIQVLIKSWSNSVGFSRLRYKVLFIVSVLVVLIIISAVEYVGSNLIVKLVQKYCQKKD